jgi:hypothetical protein
MQRDISPLKAVLLWAVSLSLADINTVVSILAGLAALGYSLHKWIDYMRRKKG